MSQEKSLFVWVEEKELDEFYTTKFLELLLEYGFVWSPGDPVALSINLGEDKTIQFLLDFSNFVEGVDELKASKALTKIKEIYNKEYYKLLAASKNKHYSRYEWFSKAHEIFREFMFDKSGEVIEGGFTGETFTLKKDPLSPTTEDYADDYILSPSFEDFDDRRIAPSEIFTDEDSLSSRAECITDGRPLSQTTETPANEKTISIKNWLVPEHEAIAETNFLPPLARTSTESGSLLTTFENISRNFPLQEGGDFKSTILLSQNSSRSPSPATSRSPSPASRKSPSPASRKSFSPASRKSFSPASRRSLSPASRRSLSPASRRSLSTDSKRSLYLAYKKSPFKAARNPLSPTAIKLSVPVDTPSLSSIRSISPAERKSLPPVVMRSLPVRRSLSPVSRRSLSPVSRRSLSPVSRRSLSPAFRRSLSPAFRRSLSSVFRRSLSPAPRGPQSPADKGYFSPASAPHFSAIVQSSPSSDESPPPANDSITISPNAQVTRNSFSLVSRRSCSPPARFSPTASIPLSPVPRKSLSPVARVSVLHATRTSLSPTFRRKFSVSQAGTSHAKQQRSYVSENSENLSTTEAAEERNQVRSQSNRPIPKRNLQPLMDIMTPTRSGNEITSCPTYSGVQWILHKASSATDSSLSNVEGANIPKNEPASEIMDRSSKSNSPRDILSRKEETSSQGTETAENCDSNNSELRNFVQSAALQTIENVNRRSDFVLTGASGRIDHNRIFSEAATNMLCRLPPSLASESKAFILHFLQEMLKRK